MYNRFLTLAAAGTPALLPLTGTDVLPFVAAGLGSMFAGILLLRAAGRRAR